MRAPSDKHFIHGSVFLLANRLQALGDRVTREMTSKQWFVLLAVAQLQGQPQISQVAQEVGSSRQNTTKLLEQLAQKGYVRLVESPTDHRSRLVHLTKKAARRMAVISDEGGRFVQRLFVGIPDKEIAVTVQVLKQVFANIEAMESENESSEEA